MRGRWLESTILGALVLQFHGALVWLARTWRETTYESWGFLALILMVVILRRGLPARRERLSTPHLSGVLSLAVLDLALAPLEINVLSAALGICAFHLWLVAFRAYAGRWYLQPQLWLALLCLPVVYWANILFGYHLQHLVSRTAALFLELYGLPVTVEGTMLRVPSATIAVDSTCSGLKLLYSGVLFGVALTSGKTRVGLRGRLVFWVTLLLLLFGANVMRVLSLAMGQVQLGTPVTGWAHEGVGLVAFVMVVCVALLLWRRLCAGGWRWRHAEA